MTESDTKRAAAPPQPAPVAAKPAAKRLPPVHYVRGKAGRICVREDQLHAYIRRGYEDLGLKDEVDAENARAAAAYRERAKRAAPALPLDKAAKAESSS